MDSETGAYPFIDGFNLTVVELKLRLRIMGVDKNLNDVADLFTLANIYNQILQSGNFLTISKIKDFLDADMEKSEFINLLHKKRSRDYLEQKERKSIGNGSKIALNSGSNKNWNESFENFISEDKEINTGSERAKNEPFLYDNNLNDNNYSEFVDNINKDYERLIEESQNNIKSKKNYNDQMNTKLTQNFDGEPPIRRSTIDNSLNNKCDKDRKIKQYKEEANLFNVPISRKQSEKNIPLLYNPNSNNMPNFNNQSSNFIKTPSNSNKNLINVDNVSMKQNILNNNQNIKYPFNRSISNLERDPPSLNLNENNYPKNQNRNSTSNNQLVEMKNKVIPNNDPRTINQNKFVKLQAYSNTNVYELNNRNNNNPVVFNSINNLKSRSNPVLQYVTIGIKSTEEYKKKSSANSKGKGNLNSNSSFVNNNFEAKVDVKEFSAKNSNILDNIMLILKEDYKSMIVLFLVVGGIGIFLNLECFSEIRGLIQSIDFKENENEKLLICFIILVLLFSLFVFYKIKENSFYEKVATEDYKLMKEILETSKNKEDNCDLIGLFENNLIKDNSEKHSLKESIYKNHVLPLIRSLKNKEAIIEEAEVLIQDQLQKVWRLKQ